jgi:hypothetical protein
MKKKKNWHINVQTPLLDWHTSILSDYPSLEGALLHIIKREVIEPNFWRHSITIDGITFPLYKEK